MAEFYDNNVKYFLNNVLYTPAGSLPKGGQWVVGFDDLEGNIFPAIRQALTYENRTWNIEKALKVITDPAYQEARGCILCQAVDLPGESIVANPEGNIMSNAFIRSYVGQGRNQFPAMRMTFLETNVSFADNFLRPWVIATGNFGLVARQKGDTRNYRTNLFAYKLGTYSPQVPPVILMKMSFYDVCCISVSNEEYNYSPQSGTPLMREAQFVYNYYTVETDMAEPFFDVGNPTIGQGAPLYAQAQNSNKGLQKEVALGQGTLGGSRVTVQEERESTLTARQKAVIQAAFARQPVSSTIPFDKTFARLKNELRNEPLLRESFAMVKPRNQ